MGWPLRIACKFSYQYWVESYGLPIERVEVIDAFLDESQDVVKELNTLQRFRRTAKEVLKTAIERAVAVPGHERPFAFVEIFSEDGDSMQVIDKVHMGFELTDKPLDLWVVSLWKDGDEDDIKRTQFGGLECALRVFEGILEQETARWASTISFECPVE